MIVSLHREDGQTLRQLEKQFDMSRFGVMRHLSVLEEASLITTVRKGRFKHHYLNTAPLREVQDKWFRPLLETPAGVACAG